MVVSIAFHVLYVSVLLYQYMYYALLFVSMYFGPIISLQAQFLIIASDLFIHAS